MSATMTEQELEAQRRLQEAAKSLALKSLMKEASWEQFFQYFHFKEVSFIAKAYFERADSRGISIENAMAVTGEWLRHRWGDVNRRLDEKEPVESLIAEGAALAALDKGADSWTLPDVVRFIYHYQDVHLGNEGTAGFATVDVQEFKSVFSEYDKDGNGLRARELWAIFNDLGFEFTTVEDQKEIIHLVKAADKDKSGTIDFQEFLYIIRKITEKEKLDGRKREARLIGESGMPLEECDQWLEVFQSAAGEADSIIISDMRSLFESIELKWDAEGSKQMMAWLREVDEDSNGEIDFGEFCTLVQKMWDKDFGHIRRLSATALTEAASKMTPRSGSKDRGGSQEPSSPVPVRRRSKERPKASWVAYVTESAEKELEPSSPKSKQIIKKFQEALTHS